MPPITTTTLFQIVPWFVLLYLTYVAFMLRNRIWCTFRRADRTKVEKWARAKNPDGSWGDIEFDGGLYHVEPARTVIQWKTMLGFFPMPVRAADYRHGSARALHPDSFDSTFTAEERKQLDKTDNLRGLMVGSQQALKGQMKKGLLEQYMPFIVIIGFAIVGYMIFQQQHRLDMLGAGQNVIESQLGRIINSLP